MAIVKGDRKCVQRRAVRRDGWTKARRAVFLDQLAVTCNITMAAQAAGMHPHSARALKRRDGEFALLWDDAFAFGREQLEEELIACALGQVASGHNPTMAERNTPPPTPPFDPDLAIRVLQLRDGYHGKGRRVGIGLPRQSEVDAALMKRLEALVARVTS